ncbi:MAG: ATP-grasp domain-containing protein, partial [Alphaproteobacteria bacterium]
AAEAGVATVPGFMGEVTEAAEAVRIAREIGYPVMLKASAGGGGKGMRIARNDSECREGFAAARSEAESSFGDGRLFIEKFIEEPRHIEIQILGDAQGNLVHLGERECSIQRRHQKIIEESPSPFVDARMRAEMGAQAVALARAVGYRSAGTVEFIVDAAHNFYFLEMNTRLQVEHPVTECVTGIDLVEQMIRIAAGESLGFAQEDVAFRGWAVESRIYAEDPYRGFLPSIGRLTRYCEPPKAEGVRVDSGVFEGAEISLYYDPMIAKLITWGETRESAIGRMRDALDAFYIRGIAHNIPFLGAVMGHPRFREGRLSTDFIDTEYGDGFHGAPLDQELADMMMAAACFMHAVECSRAAQVAGRMREVRGPQEHDWVILIDGRQETAGILPTRDGARVRLGERELALASAWVPGNPVFSGEIDGKGVTIEVDRLSLGYCLMSRGAAVRVMVLEPQVAALMPLMPEPVDGGSSRTLTCPMPGLVVSVAVAPGDEVKAGQALVVVEAMKMENILRAERDGVVEKVNVKPGDSLAVDDVIIEFA